MDTDTGVVFTPTDAPCSRPALALRAGAGAQHVSQETAAQPLPKAEVRSELYALHIVLISAETASQATCPGDSTPARAPRDPCVWTLSSYEAVSTLSHTTLSHGAGLGGSTLSARRLWSPAVVELGSRSKARDMPVIHLMSTRASAPALTCSTAGLGLRD